MCWRFGCRAIVVVIVEVVVVLGSSTLLQIPVPVFHPYVGRVLLWYASTVIIIVLWFCGSLLWHSKYFIRSGTLVDKPKVVLLSTFVLDRHSGGGRWNVAAYHLPYLP